MILRHSAPTGRCLGVLLLLVASCSIGSSAIGVNYGTMANNLPSPAEVVQLIQSTYISKVKVYSADAAILSAFANTGISIVAGVTNDQIPSMAASESYAQQWLTKNVATHVPATNIVALAVGNEVLTASPNMSNDLVPAMQNLYTGLSNLGLSDKIKVSTPHSYGVLSTSYPPSNGIFRTDLSGPVFVPLLNFLSQTGSTFMINAYPYFAYRDTTTKVSISYALFEPNVVVVDSVTGLRYDNLFDAQVDAVYAAMAKLGHQDVPITVSETGWPSLGDPGEPGASITDARTYVSNLLQHINSDGGSPARPGVPIETFIFALFNENQKPGPTSERNFGLFLPDRTAVYNVGLTINSSGSTPPPPAVAPSPPSSSTPPPAGTPPPPSSSTPSPPAGTPPPPSSSTPPPAGTPPPPSSSIPPPPSSPSNSSSPPPSTASPPPPLSSSPPPPPASSPPPPYPVPHVPPSGPTPSSPPPSTASPPASTPSPPALIPSPPASTPPPKSTPPPPPSFFTPPPGSTTPSPVVAASPPPPARGTPPFLPGSPPPPTAGSPPPPPPKTTPSSPPPAPATSPPPAAASPPPVAQSPPPAAASPPPSTPEVPTPVPPGTPPAPPGTPSGPNTWCVAKPGAPAKDLLIALDYACGEGGANCTEIQTGGTCYYPNTLFSHASFAFSEYYAQNGRNYWNCYFGNSSLITITNPSYTGCTYP